ncbi:MAG: right-handed parallel beta-helix repeat-containing protein [Candidatus Heimdallarchaeota archaeon]|nr:right-handed parallel beta-helix repeat-containing protein [Candidatus Heimdallarchaeota archaeon]MCK4954099.1 right-handed parallel beta-helix repeat-containing protein [Candidatus Heimdallarchaeota archaeon]
MIINRKKILGITLSILIALSIFLIVYFTTIYRPRIKDTDNIVIWNDADFKNYRFGGKGTEANPYLIENLNITTLSHEGIYIAHTTKYFIIRNCYVNAIKTGIFIDHVADETAVISFNTLEKNADSGIYITNSDNIQIYNNTLLSNWDGITIEDSQNSILQNNLCEDNRNKGIFLYNSLNSFIGNSVSINNRYGGIILENSPYATLTENICEDSSGYGSNWPTASDENGGFGIYLRSSPNSTMIKNHLSSNYDSNIYIDSSANLSIINNTLLNNGLAFESKTTVYFPVVNRLKYTNVDYYLSFTIEDNSVNDKPLGFYTHLSNETFTSTTDGQMIFVNCSNLQIENLNMFNGSGISLYFSENARIINSSISSMSRNGLSLFNSHGSRIMNNTVYNNVVDGVLIYNSNYTNVSNNSCYENGDDGLTVMYSSNNIISENTLFNNSDSGLTNRGTDTNLITNNAFMKNKQEGLIISFSTNTNVTFNTCNNNNLDGILLQESLYSSIANNSVFDNSDNGISFRSSSFNLLVNNSIENNLGSGIYFITLIGEAISENNSIHHNIIADSNSYGVKIGSGAFNAVHHNNFTDNNLGSSSQAYDSGSENIWYDILSMEGNFWSDYVGPGSYSIDGSANSEDLYPL